MAPKGPGVFVLLRIWAGPGPGLGQAWAEPGPGPGRHFSCDLSPSAQPSAQPKRSQHPEAGSESLDLSPSAQLSAQPKRSQRPEAGSGETLGLSPFLEAQVIFF